MRCQAFPESDAPVSTTGQDPGMWHSFGFGAHTHVCIQAKTQQEAAQQGGVILTVPLWRTEGYAGICWGVQSELNIFITLVSCLLCFKRNVHFCLLVQLRSYV